MSEPESKYPTIRDMIDGLTVLDKVGLGALAVQVLVAPDSTMQAIAREIAGSDYDQRPALMIDLTATKDTGRLPATIASTDRMTSGSGGMPSTRTQ